MLKDLVVALAHAENAVKPVNRKRAMHGRDGLVIHRLVVAIISLVREIGFDDEVRQHGAGSATTTTVPTKPHRPHRAHCHRHHQRSLVGTL